MMLDVECGGCFCRSRLCGYICEWLKRLPIANVRFGEKNCDRYYTPAAEDEMVFAILMATLFVLPSKCARSSSECSEYSRARARTNFKLGSAIVKCSCSRGQ